MSIRSNKIALFIDGPNLFATAKTLGFDIDYKRLLKEFQSRGTLVRAFYYTAIIEDQEFVAIRPLIDWLDYNGYTVVAKATKEFIDASGRRKVKGNMDIERLRWMPWRCPHTLTRWFSSQVMAIFVRWWKPYSAAASG
jgi:uncharacterized LabA/DUF88 family protein